MRVVGWAPLALLLCGGFGTRAQGPVGQGTAQGIGGQGPGVYTPAPAVLGYSVTGRVTCADTQHPARFALVNLTSASSGEEGGGRGRGLSARTDLDGDFIVSNVPAGDYYVTAALAGYVNEAQAVQAALSAGGDALNALSGVPLIHVAAGGAAAQVSLQRGAVIAGTVQWDDGSPAGGVQVTPLLSAAAGTPGAAQTPGSTQTGGATQANGPGPGQFGRFPGSASTDDRGRFRIAGLAPGTYLLRAGVQAPVRARGDERGFSRTLSLFVYAPDKPRRTDAVPVTLSAGEEHAEVTITLGLTGLHTVSGAVSSPGAAVRSGTVTLTDTQDGTLTRTGYIGPDGGFAVMYLPPGTYSMQVNASSQAQGSFGRGASSTGSDAGLRFQPLQESLTVADGDISGVSVNVTPASTASASQ